MHAYKSGNGVQAPFPFRNFRALLLTQLLLELGELMHGDLLLLVQNLFDTLNLLDL